jgi:ribosomal protein S6--L-glutamate ligase
VLRPRIAMLLQRSSADRRPSVSAVTAELIARLRARHGAEVGLLLPEDAPLELGTFASDYDLYVLKAKTPLTLAIAAAASASGAVVVNSFEASSLARDKLAATAILAAAGVPVPPSWSTGQPPLLEQVLTAGPLWLKPQRGSHGLGVRRFASADELANVPAESTDLYGLPVPVFAQSDVPSTGVDLKVYVVGHHTWAISRRFPAHTLEEKLGAPASISRDIRQAALAAGAALGLELYGVDFIVQGDQFWAVDVNAFPGYKGVPEAPAALATYLYASATCGGRVAA